MVFASTVLMLAGSPQTFLGAANAQESLFLVGEILAVYGRHVSNDIGQTVAQIWNDGHGYKIGTEEAINSDPRIPIRLLPPGQLPHLVHGQPVL